jgi:hypothetical protein
MVGPGSRLKEFQVKTGSPCYRSTPPDHELCTYSRGDNSGSSSDSFFFCDKKVFNLVGFFSNVAASVSFSFSFFFSCSPSKGVIFQRVRPCGGGDRFGLAPPPPPPRTTQAKR